MFGIINIDAMEKTTLGSFIRVPSPIPSTIALAKNIILFFNAAKLNECSTEMQVLSMVDARIILGMKSELEEKKRSLLVTRNALHELQQKKQEIEEQQKQFDMHMQCYNQRISGVYAKLYTAIAQVAATKQVGVIFPVIGTLYINPELDVTVEVFEKMNSNYLQEISDQQIQ
jgi:Skp family chaperone for outer membrane proteins